MTFDEAFKELLKIEGGFVDHPDDPGGATNHGVTVSVARAAGYTGDMRDLSIDLVKRIYIERYWQPIQVDELPAPLRMAVFDAAVNSGPGQSAKWLQRALGIKEDGVIGPVTIKAAWVSDYQTVLRKMLGYRLQFMTNLSTWASFGRGWARRIVKLMV